jgi:hypothetical protein
VEMCFYEIHIFVCLWENTEKLNILKLGLRKRRRLRFFVPMLCHPEQSCIFKWLSVNQSFHYDVHNSLAQAHCSLRTHEIFKFHLNVTPLSISRFSSSLFQVFSPLNCCMHRYYHYISFQNTTVNYANFPADLRVGEE